jgi:hypothetical protein
MFAHGVRESVRMASVSHLLTTVDLSDRHDPGPDAREMWVDARLHAVLDSGRRTLLLGDRGWGGAVGWYWTEEPSEEERRRVEREAPGIWADVTAEQLENEARMVVGPEGAYGEVTDEESARLHWEALAKHLRARRIEITGEELAALRHDVELSERVLARIGRER